jgi:hypothetical protein
MNEEQPQQAQPSEPTEEELRAALEEQMRRISVQDVILQTVVTLVNLSGRRLTAEGEKDVEQARLGIEAVRALLPLCPEDQVGPVKEAISQLQMIFAREAQQPGGERPQESEQQSEQQKPDPAREKARSKLWTPPGT